MTDKVSLDAEKEEEKKQLRRSFRGAFKILKGTGNAIQKHIQAFGPWNSRELHFHYVVMCITMYSRKCMCLKYKTKTILHC